MSFDRQGFRLTTLNTTSDIVASSCLSSVKTHIWIAIFYTIDYYCDSLWTRCSCLLHFIYFFLPLSEISFSFLSPPEFERSTRDVFVQNCTHVVCWRLDCCHQGNNNPWYAYILREKKHFSQHCNRSFSNCLLSYQAFDLEWGWTSNLVVTETSI